MGILDAPALLKDRTATKTVRPTGSPADYNTDGTADNVEIQAAVDAVNAAGGGTVFLGKGSYNLTTRVNIPANVTLQGEGIEATIITQPNATNLPRMIGNKNYGTTGDNNITIKDLSVDGNGANQSTTSLGINLRTGDNVRLDNVYVHGCRDENIYLRQITNIVVMRVKSNAGGRDGIVFDTCSKVAVSNSDTSSNGTGGSRSGLYVANSDNVKITNCQSDSNPYHGFDISGAGSFRVSVSNSNAGSNGRYGIYCGLGPSAAVLSGNTLTSNSYGGIGTENNSNVNIIGNTFDSNAYGAYLDSCTDINVNGNYFLNTQKSAISLHGTAFSTVTGNHIRNSSQLTNNTYFDIILESNTGGLYTLQSATYNNVVGNTCVADATNKVGAAIKTGTSTDNFNTISNNTCYGMPNRIVISGSGAHQAVFNNGNVNPQGYYLIGNTTGTFGLDPINGTLQDITLTGNAIFTLGNAQLRGQIVTFIIRQDATGGWTATWPANVKFAQSSFVVSSPASSIDTITLTYDGTNWNEVARAQATHGDGDVTGPSSSTDNFLARYDGTTGKLIQNSTVELSDAGNMYFPVNQSVNLSANSSTGGITPNIKFSLAHTMARPWISWYDESARLRASTGYHTTDYASGDLHIAYEVKTSMDPAGATPTGMATRMSLKTDSDLTDVSFPNAANFYVRNASSNMLALDTSTGNTALGDGTNSSINLAFNGRTWVGYNGANAYFGGSTGKGLAFAVNASSFGTGIQALLTSGGNFGLGLTTNINSRLTLAADTTAAGGILFGTDTNLYRSAAGVLNIGGGKITNSGTPTTSSDLVNKGYVDGISGATDRTVTKTVGGTGMSADYVCDGVADDVEIQAALTAVAATGGTVALRGFTYDITASLSISSNTTLVGEGNATVLKAGTNLNDAVIKGNGRINSTTVRDLYINGNSANQSTSGTGIEIDGFYNHFINVWAIDLKTYGINLKSTTNSSENIIDGGRYNGATYGIYLQSGNNDFIIRDVTAYGGNTNMHLEGGGGRLSGIILYTASAQNFYTSKQVDINGIRLGDAPIGMYLDGELNNLYGVWSGVNITDLNATQITNHTIYMLTGTGLTALLSIVGWHGNNSTNADLSMDGPGLHKLKILTNYLTIAAEDIVGSTVQSQSVIRQPDYPLSTAPASPVRGMIYLDDGTNTGSGKQTWRRYDGGWIDFGPVAADGSLVAKLGNNKIAQLNDGTNGSAIWGQNMGIISASSEAKFSSRSSFPYVFYFGGTLNSMTPGTEKFRIASTGMTSAIPLDMGSHLISNVTDPVSAQDATTKAWVAANTAASITGTANQITASASTGAITLSFPTNLFNNGYFRVGGSATPANTTAGDLTTTRISVGNGSLSDANGAVSYIGGTMTTTASQSAIANNFSTTLTPTTNSATNFRNNNFITIWNPATGITQSQVYGNYVDNRIRGDGLVTSVYGQYTQAFVYDSSSAATVQATNVFGIQGLIAGRPSGTSTGTINTGITFDSAGVASIGLTATTLVGFRAVNHSTGNTITNSYGVDVQGMSRGTAANIGVRIAAPSGATANYALQLSDTAGTAPGGITFGTDVTLYRSAADVLATDDDLSLKTVGKGLQIKEGTNGKQGVAVLVGGTVTVSTTSVTANSRIQLTSNVGGGTPGWLRVSARTAGTSFTILSSSNTDTSTVAYFITEPSA